MGISKEFFDELIAYVDAGDDVSDDLLNEAVEGLVEQIVALKRRVDSLEALNVPIG